jgi:hypothetical protein
MIAGIMFPPVLSNIHPTLYMILREMAMDFVEKAGVGFHLWFAVFPEGVARSKRICLCIALR